MKNVGVVICNYNGEKCIIKCLEAIFNSDIMNFDVFVIDNASTDNSIDIIKKQYGDMVNIICNEENFGGSGGFGRGIRECEKLGYEYIALIDNDAFVDKDTIRILYQYMCQHSECVIAGAKIMMLNKKDYIMDYAARIDFDIQWTGSDWYNKLEDKSSYEIRECDFVAATTALVRTEAIIKAGKMDEKNFIYYDDIDLSYRIHLAGYKNISIGTCKSWHKSSLCNNVKSNFGDYYFTRNELRFFAKYIDDNKLEEYENYILENTFSQLYGSLRKGRLDVFHTKNHIFQDFLNDIRGKAREGIIIQYMNEKQPKFKDLLGNSTKIFIRKSGDNREKVISRLEKYINDNGLSLKIVKEWDNIEEIQESRCDISFVTCKHVKDITDDILPIVYIDEYLNVISTKQDYIYFKNYYEQLYMYKKMFADRLHTTICKIRAER